MPAFSKTMAKGHKSQGKRMNEVIMVICLIFLSYLISTHYEYTLSELDQCLLLIFVHRGFYIDLSPSLEVEHVL